MIRKKELLERIEILEQQNESLKFLLENDRDDCVIDRVYRGYSSTRVAKYIYNGELCSVSLDEIANLLLEVIENHIESALIKATGFTDKFYKLDKKNKTLIDVTDLQHKIDNAKAENLKQSAQAFGDVLKNLYLSQKQKTQKKSKLTEKCSEKCDCEKKTSKKRRSKNA